MSEARERAIIHRAETAPGRYFWKWGSGQPPLFFTPVSRDPEAELGEFVALRKDVLEREIESRVEEAGFEFVELEWGGSDARPILRLRVDRPGSTPGDGIRVEDCVKVSRTLEPWLDESSGLPERYTLEVSSPGVERPLVRRRDFERFTGEAVRVKAVRAPEGVASARFEAVLDGVEGEVGEGDADYRIRLRLSDGTTLVLPRSAVVRVHLVYRWEEED